METMQIHIEPQTSERMSRPYVPLVPSREVMVGVAPVVRYATWAEHRARIQQAETEARARQ